MLLPTIDGLSEKAREILELGCESYTRLVCEGPGNAEAKKLLVSLSPDDVFTDKTKHSPENTRAVISGLWLLHDWLDESHTISQGLHSPTGSFWHAIMHRREGDFSNSKYWYARCLNHPALNVLAPVAADIVHKQPADNALLRLVASGWNPNALVDLVEASLHAENSANHRVCVHLQQLEWKVLFEHCAR